MAGQIKDGGPAFPIVGTHEQVLETGMTLRDYFAAQAIGGLMSMIAAGKHELNFMDGATNEERLAVAGYRVADAMLRAREGGAA